MIRRHAQGGDRQALVDMFQLVSDPAMFGLHRVPTTFFVERVHEAVSSGRLLLVPGWPQMPAYGWTPVSRGAPAEYHLARRIMKDQDHLAFEGDKYLLVPAESWTDLRRLDRHEVVPRNQAEDVLKRMAAHSAFSDRKATLEEASSSLADLQTPHARERLFLLRHPRRRVASSGASGSPAASPSNLHRRDAHVDPGMGRLVVRVLSPSELQLQGLPSMYPDWV